MSPVPATERRSRKLAKTASLEVEVLGVAGLLPRPPVRIHRQDEPLVDLEGWDAVEDWLIQYITG